MLRGGPMHQASVGHLTAGTGRVLWNFTLPEGGWFEDPALANGTLYINGKVNYPGKEWPVSTLYALDARTGQVRWNVNGSSREPTVANGSIFSVLSAQVLDQETGKVRWTFPWPYRVGQPVPAMGDGRIFFINDRMEQIYALDLVTHTVAWNFSAVVPGTPGYRAIFHHSSVPIEDSLYLVSYAVDRGTLFKLNARTGEQVWSNNQTSVTSVPAVWKDTVVFLDWGHGIAGVNATTGQKKWSFEPGSTVSHVPVIWNGTAYIATSNKEVLAVDVATGQELWRFTTDDYPTCRATKGCLRHYTLPAVLDGVLFAEGFDSLYALNARNGSLLWQTPIPKGSSWTSPVVMDNIVYLAVDNVLYAIEWGGKPPRA